MRYPFCGWLMQKRKTDAKAPAYSRSFPLLGKWNIDLFAVGVRWGGWQSLLYCPVILPHIMLSVKPFCGIIIFTKNGTQANVIRLIIQPLRSMSSWVSEGNRRIYTTSVMRRFFDFGHSPSAQNDTKFDAFFLTDIGTHHIPYKGHFVVWEEKTHNMEYYIQIPARKKEYFGCFFAGSAVYKAFLICYYI